MMAMLEVTNGVKRSTPMTVKEAQRLKKDALMSPDNPEYGGKPRILTPTAFDALTGTGSVGIIRNPLKSR